MHVHMYIKSVNKKQNVYPSTRSQFQMHGLSLILSLNTLFIFFILFNVSLSFFTYLFLNKIMQVKANNKLCLIILDIPSIFVCAK